MSQGNDRLPLWVADANWLKANLDSGQFRIIDVRPTIEALQAGYPWGHIPGAVHLDLTELFTEVDGVPGKLVDTAIGEQALSRAGVSNDQPTIIYDADGGPLAARLAWLLDYWGHSQTAILEGGWEAWQAVNGPISTEPAPIPPASYRSRPRPERMATLDWIQARRGSSETLFVDVRSAQEYARGHLPQAIHIPWESMGAEGHGWRFVEPAELRHRLALAGLTPDKEIVVYCETGARSAFAYWALRLAGFERVRNYEGSWAEWSRRAATSPDLARPARAG